MRFCRNDYEDGRQHEDEDTGFSERWMLIVEDSIHTLRFVLSNSGEVIDTARRWENHTFSR